MKGIILAAGKGTRLYPITIPVSKPLLPVYDKPLIFYPLSLMITAGIKDILIIVPPAHEDDFSNLLGDGSLFGIKISYMVQKVQRGIADAFILGEEFIAGDPVCLILGDNIFYIDNIEQKLEGAYRGHGATVFGLYHEHPQAFGVIEFDKKGNVLGLEEKPAKPKSHYIVPGIYFYDENVTEYAKKLAPSQRGELEITDINKMYLDKNELFVSVLHGNYIWHDAGTAESILSASIGIKNLLSKKIIIGSPELAAFEKGFIDINGLKLSSDKYSSSEYGKLLNEFSDAAE